jgi:hypothetical protein
MCSRPRVIGHSLLQRRFDSTICVMMASFSKCKQHHRVARDIFRVVSSRAVSAEEGLFITACLTISDRLRETRVCHRIVCSRVKYQQVHQHIA